jgi:hypothetical protein
MDEVVYSGKHSLFFESSELCVIKYDGSPLEADIQKFHSELRRWSYGKPRFSMLVDLSTTGDVEPAARKAAAETLDVPNLTAVAGYGPSWPVRATATLTAALIRAFGKVKCPIRFFATEQDARAWLDGFNKSADVIAPTAPRAPSEQAPHP